VKTDIYVKIEGTRKDVTVAYFNALYQDSTIKIHLVIKTVYTLNQEKYYMGVVSK
jgi:hypothetical protein